jgi:pimeloyl-ACP methyl ester carboxylesterase
MATEVTRESRTRDKKPARVEREGVAPAALAAEGGKRKLHPGVRPAEHAVFLVPGLLGFENFDTFSYFADRVVAALRSGLERSWGGPVPVLAVPIPPTASLRDRQRTLIKTLADRLHALEHADRPLTVHLVGHSTGGVDANLLTHAYPIEAPSWEDLDPRAPALRARIRSVISIAAPHQGACIAADPLASLLRNGDLRGVPGFAQVVGKFLASVASDFETQTVVSSALREGGKTKRFLGSVFKQWDLLEDLQPTRDPSALQLKEGVLRRSFVTIAGSPVLGVSTTPPEDSFYRELSQRASGWTTGSAETGSLVQASVARLQRAIDAGENDVPIIKADGIELPAKLDAGLNDGVVNSARQLIDPDDASELAGIVVSDHFDVVGYYDRHAFKVELDGHETATQVLSGLLHSGSGFRDDQFFELYRRVADVIAGAF